ncbi:hypothetical protein [Kineococcus rubinsiae]|uniref:hypothetical protein n=1 Tax=Kineococcus rubinsiae TaxID=2609562 RepID=UPI0014304097|nr:hypothetical protein [Kineococcus rubinsiae]NIZ91765.1 hypothetical protein [Kineococcus rubinsiae]
MTDLTPQVQIVDLPVFADDHKIGDLVTLHPDYVGDKHDTNRVYEITKRPSRSSERNYVATPLDGSKGLRGPAQLWKPYTGDAAAARATAAANSVIEPDFGAVVTILGPNSYPRRHALRGRQRPRPPSPPGQARRRQRALPARHPPHPAADPRPHHPAAQLNHRWSAADTAADHSGAPHPDPPAIRPERSTT